MQFIPVIPSLESVLPSQGDPNVPEVQGSEQWPGGFNAILAKELDTDETSVNIEEEDAVQNAFSSLVLALSDETLPESENEVGLKLDDMLSDIIEEETDFSEKIAQPKSSPIIVLSSPDSVLLDGQAIEGQGVQGKAIDNISRSIPDQTISAAKEIVEMPDNPTMNSTSEHPESELNLEKVITIEASQQKGSDKPVFQRTGELLAETVPKVSGEGIDVLQETDAAGVKEKPVTLSGDMEDQGIKEMMGNVKSVSKNEANEIKSNDTKESFEKTAQLDNSSKIPAPLSNNENSDTGKDSGSSGSNQGSSALGFQKLTSQDSKVDFADITTLNSTETVQGTIEAAQGIAVDLSTEVDAVSVKEVKPQAASHVFEDQLMDQVSNSVRLTMKQGGGEARMRLYPESLGELKIELSVEDGVMKAKFLVDNAMVKDVIESNFDKLRDALTNNGLKVESFSVSVDQQNKGTNLENQSFSQFEGANIIDKETPAIDQHEGLPEHSKAYSDADDSMINIFT